MYADVDRFFGILALAVVGCRGCAHPLSQKHKCSVFAGEQWDPPSGTGQWTQITRWARGGRPTPYTSLSLTLLV